MALYMLSLFIFPCNDTCNKDNHSAPVTVEQAQDHHEEENDICSPFCYCACCAVSFIVANVQMPELVVNFPPATYDNYSSNFSSSFSTSFWQPPKLS